MTTTQSKKTSLANRHLSHCDHLAIFPFCSQATTGAPWCCRLFGGYLERCHKLLLSFYQFCISTARTSYLDLSLYDVDTGKSCIWTAGFKCAILARYCSLIAWITHFKLREVVSRYFAKKTSGSDPCIKINFYSNISDKVPFLLFLSTDCWDILYPHRQKLGTLKKNSNRFIYLIWHVF